nr:hypothetical protein 6 [bacterium]
MNIEIMKAKNKLAESKKRFKDLDIKVSAYVLTIRDCLDPYADSGVELDTEKALELTKELHLVVEEMKELKVKIQKLEKDLDV